MHGAEMRVAETRAANRALRKAFGIGICSVEEIGSSGAAAPYRRQISKIPPQPANGNYGGPKVRDHVGDRRALRDAQVGSAGTGELEHLVLAPAGAQAPQELKDPTLVKSYATDFCGVKILREATREQVENFVAHLADWAEKDRNALLCQLNSYLSPKQGAA